MLPSELFSGDLGACLNNRPCDALLLEAQSETWFSNQLAWLLDPKGSHGLGGSFLQLFIERIAQRRSLHDEKHRKATSLKWGKAGPGVGAKGFHLSNSSVFREFFLSRTQKRKADSALFCDLVVADLDTKDGLFLTIENKLFTTDRVSQLDDYEQCVNEKFKRAKIREFVYLTLHGVGSANATRDQDWVKLGWLTDVREILACSLVQRKKAADATGRAEELAGLLNWMHDLSALTMSRQCNLPAFENWLRKTCGELLLEELQRLNDGKSGQWGWDTRKKASFLLKHSSHPSIGLQIALATGLVVTVQVRRSNLSKKSGKEKILIPLGAHPDQVLNLVDIAARDICHMFFQTKERYFADKRRRKNRSTDDAIARELNLIYRHRYALPILLKFAGIQAGRRASKTESETNKFEQE
jgi:hypothetical protein